VEHLATTIEFQMSLLLFVSLTGYLLASRIGQPAVVGIILVGLVVDPVRWSDHVYGLHQEHCPSGSSGPAFCHRPGIQHQGPDQSQVFCHRNRRRGGSPCRRILGLQAFDLDLSASLFIGVAITATSIAITADSLREMGRLHTDAAKAIIRRSRGG